MLLLRGPGLIGGDTFDGAIRVKCPQPLVGHKPWSHFTGTCWTASRLGGGESLDQAVARAIGVGSARGSFIASGAPVGSGDRGYISFAGPDRPLTPEHDPVRAYDYLFGSLKGGDGGAAAAATRLANRKSVLDTVRGDIDRLSARIPSSERAKLDVHLGAVRALEKQLGATVAPTCVYSPPAASKLKVPDVVRLQMKTLAAAFACDVTRVGSVMFAMGGGDNIDIDFIPDFRTFGYHDLTHATNGNKSGDGSLPGDIIAIADDYWTAIDALNATILAEFIDQLKALPEGTGTVFDNTLIVWVHEMADGSTHWDLDGVPMVMASGKNITALKHGQFVTDAPRTRWNDALVSIANAVGYPITTFGDPAHCVGPLASLRA